MKTFREYLSSREETLNEGFGSFITARLKSMLKWGIIISILHGFGSSGLNINDLISKAESFIPKTEITTPEQFKDAAEETKENLKDAVEDEQKANSENSYDYRRGTLYNKYPNAVGEVFDNIIGPMINKYNTFKYGIVDGGMYGVDTEEKQKIEKFLNNSEEKLKNTADSTKKAFNNFKEKNKKNVDTAKQFADDLSDKAKEAAAGRIKKFRGVN